MADAGVGSSGRPLVGVIVDRANAYGRSVLRGVLQYAGLERRWLLYVEADRLLVDGGELPVLDGAILSSVSSQIFDQAVRRSRHCVICSGGWPGDDWPVVHLDDYAVGRQAAEHLMDLRLEHFGYYWGAEYSVSQQRLLGFQTALAERGFRCQTCPFEAPTPAQRLAHAHRAVAVEWLRRLPKPIGILAFDDGWANDLAEVCRQADLVVPDQVAIVGVNNDDLICETTTPPLSSVETGYGRMGYAAAHMLDRLMAGATLREQERHVLLPPLGVVQRQSSSTLAISDPDVARALRFIREHACDPCSVADILKVVPVGRRWLERQFMSRLGRTPHDEITRVRVETAKRLLLRSDLRVTEITSKCGFAHMKNLNAAFRKLTGTTPGAFRRDSGSLATTVR